MSKRKKNKLSLYKKEVEEFFKYEKHYNNKVEDFIRDYKVDTDEIFLKVLNLINHNLQNKIF